MWCLLTGCVQFLLRCKSHFTGATTSNCTITGLCITCCHDIDSAMNPLSNTRGRLSTRTAETELQVLDSENAGKNLQQKTRQFWWNWQETKKQTCQIRNWNQSPNTKAEQIWKCWCIRCTNTNVKQNKYQYNNNISFLSQTIHNNIHHTKVIYQNCYKYPPA